MTDARPSLSFDRYVESIRSDMSSAVESLGRTPPDAPVPSCPDWPASELRDHMAGVAVFWTQQLRMADPDAGEPDFGPEIRDRYKLPLAELRDTLLSELAEAGPDRPCWNWSGRNKTSGWVARRMTQEMAVHRCDADLAAGRSALTIEADVAADGIDELIDTFADADPGDDLADCEVIELNGDTHTWTLAIRRDRGVRRVEREAKLRVSGGTDQLLLRLWKRPASITADGSTALLDEWDSLPIFG